MTFNPDIHHRRSIRLRDYDYASGGVYFVTLCAFHRECLFGEIVDGRMRLNEIGGIVWDCWIKIPEHFPGVMLDKSVVMPSHFHGIIHITTSPIEAAETVGTVGAKQASSASPAFSPSPAFNFDVGHTIKKLGEAGETLASPLPHGTGKGTLAAIVQNVKSVSTRKINQFRNNHGCPVWQRNYYERVIRTELELTKAREYIVNNPLKWALDKENPANQK